MTAKGRPERERRRVLVTSGLADSGVDAARALAAAGFEVITADFRRPLNLRSRHAARHHALPCDSEAAYSDALLALVRRCRPDAIVPLGTRTVIAIARRRDEVAALTTVDVPTVDAFHAGHVKSRSIADCAALGIPCPRVHTPAEAAAALRAGAVDRVVVKPDFDAGAALGLAYVRTPAELGAAIERCRAGFGSALVQEYIPGGVEAMKTVVLLFGAEAALAAAFTTRKTRQWPPEGGVSVASVSTAERELADLVLPFFHRWRWRGGAEVELKLDPRDGVHKVIEINPRFPGYLRFAGHCGLALPVLTARLALGEADAMPALYAYRTGVNYVAPTLFLGAVGRDLVRGRVLETLQASRRQLAGTAAQIGALLADPLPLVGRLVADVVDPSAGAGIYRVAT